MSTVHYPIKENGKFFKELKKNLAHTSVTRPCLGQEPELVCVYDSLLQSIASMKTPINDKTHLHIERNVDVFWFERPGQKSFLKTETSSKIEVRPVNRVDLTPEKYLMWCYHLSLNILFVVKRHKDGKVW